VEHAVENNRGRDITGDDNEYFGFSRDESIQINFYLNKNGSGEITSYFPKM
jgi:hypothetical protein